MEYRSRRLAKHIQREKTRHGTRVYYYRQSNKCRRVRLEGEYGSEDFWKSYALAASGIVPAGIDNAWGYTTDNVRIVVFAINVMLSDWGEQVFRRVSDDYLRAQKARA